MSLQRDIVDIYTKSSVYYLRLQYLIICYLIILAAAFFVLPLPREMGINGNARLIVGGLLYIGFAVLLVYAPKLLKSTVGKFLSFDKEEKEIENKLNQLSENERIELEQELWQNSSIKMSIVAQKDFVLMSKKHIIATNIFFQCLLIELFCLMVLINNDHSLLISNPITQEISDILLTYTRQTEEQVRTRSGFFSIYYWGETINKSKAFAQFNYMAESIFFIYIVFIILSLLKLCSMFLFLRPFLVRSDIFPMVKKAKTIGKIIWALLGTVIMFFVSFMMIDFTIHELYQYISQILFIDEWIHKTILIKNVMIFNILIFLHFMEDWYKLIFRKF